MSADDKVLAANASPVTATPAAPDLFAAFAVDEKAEEGGTETLLPNAGDTLFRIARTGNTAYGKLFRKLYKRNERALKSGGPEAEKLAIQMDIDLIATTILLSWKGTINFQGEQLAYSEANARRLLELKSFRKAIKDVADSEEAFKLIKDEDLEKN